MTTKDCPHCGEVVQASAIVCRFCTYDTTSQYEPCSQCAELIKTQALLCKHCSHRKPRGGADGLGIPVRPPRNPDDFRTAAAIAQPSKKLPYDGVRGQVFEVIVRQGMAGAPWRVICEGPMRVNKISADDVEAEIRRRQNLLS